MSEKWTREKILALSKDELAALLEEKLTDEQLRELYVTLKARETVRKRVKDAEELVIHAEEWASSDLERRFLELGLPPEDAQAHLKLMPLNTQLRQWGAFCHVHQGVMTLRLPNGTYVPFDPDDYGNADDPSLA